MLKSQDLSICLDSQKPGQHAVTSGACAPGNPHQHWDAASYNEPSANGGALLAFKDPEDGTCLDFDGTTQVPWLKPCADAAGQLWELTKPSAGSNLLTVKSWGAWTQFQDRSPVCLAAVGKALMMRTCDTADPHQHWSIS